MESKFLGNQANWKSYRGLAKGIYRMFDFRGLVFGFYLSRGSTSNHGNKELGTRSMEKQRGMEFGFRKTATAVMKPDRQIDR